MLRPGAVVVVLALGLGLAPSAGADAIAEIDRSADQDLDDAEHALHDLRYEHAGAQLERARSSGHNGPRALARLYRLQGELAATLGDAPGARAAFAHWLAIEPGAALARGTSPKITAPFAAAAAQLAGKSLRVAFRLVDGSSAVALEVVSDPLAMVVGARAFYRGQPDVGLADAGVARVQLALPRAGRLQVVVAALDRHGNRVAQRELTLEGGPATGESPATPDPAARVEPPATAPAATRAEPPPPARVIAPAPAPATPSRWRFHQGWVWGGAALGLGVVGGIYGLRAVQAQRQLDALNGASGDHTFVEARATADRLRTSAIIANTSFVLAGACGLATVLLWPDAPPDHPARRLSWQLGRDGARAAMEWSW